MIAQSSNLLFNASPATEMTLENHLSELRGRLIMVMSALCASFGLSLFFAPKLLEFIKRPLGTMSLQALSVEEPVFVVFKIAFVAALMITAPVAIIQAFRFLEPALKQKERDLIFILSVASPILFACGALFAYFGLLPAMLKMFFSFSKQYVQLRPQLSNYVSLVASVMAIMGLTFQVPVIMLVLGNFGIVSAGTFFKLWRHVLVGAAVVAAVITPDPTAGSMLMVMGVLLSLYFLSAFTLLLWLDLPKTMIRIKQV